MMWLVPWALGSLTANQLPRNIGRLFGPRNTNRVPDTPRSGLLWAADNDAYSGFNPDLYMTMLDKLAGIPGGLFVTCPDVVGDSEATFGLYLKWGKEILSRGLPLGYVAQDGATPDRIPWGGTSALFVGGTTEWKLSEDARRLVIAAQERGKWVHMGRVNSGRRIEYANALGCDSIDGTSVVMFPDTYMVSFAEKATAPRQGMFEPLR